MEMENYLFRYRTYSDDAISALENDKLYFSIPQKFNDPYDSLFYLDKQSFIQNVRHEWDTEMETYVKRVFGILPLDAQQFVYEEVVNRVKSESYQSEFFTNIFDLVENIKSNMRDNLKVICFSEKYLSTLMWSHYADYHKGFCLIYDKDDIKNAEIFNTEGKRVSNSVDLLKVDYAKAQKDVGPYLYYYIPEKHFSVPMGNFSEQVKSVVHLAIKTKSEEWKYEEEWRAIPKQFDIEKVNDISYIKIKAQGIFLGSQMPIEQRYKLMQIAKKKKIGLFEVWRNDDTGNFQFNFCMADFKEIRNDYKVNKLFIND